MKRFAIIALIAAAGACTAGSLQAQSHEVRANVPFDFAVGSKVMPAGHYSFYSEPNDTIVIRNSDQQISILSRTEDTGTLSGFASQLVFDKFGDHYFLREIRCPSIALNVDFPLSKLEKQTRTQLAWLGPEQTLIALN
jgi:hypothetical protein